MKKSTSSVDPAFGSRFLTSDKDVWSQNAWDHVPPPDDQHETIAAALARQRATPVPDEERETYNAKPARHWDNFYKSNADNFFKNRNWLHLEFPELVAALDESAGPKTIVEFGCGAGNSVFPLIADNKNLNLRVRAYDYSAHAVKLVQRSPQYNPSIITAAVHDLTAPDLPADLEPGSADFVLLVFVPSALHPDEWRAALKVVWRVLKPGGMVLMRDYGRHDLTQLRFKSKRLLEENLYVRGDKTRVYFFELDELALLFTSARARTADIQVHEQTQIEDETGDADGGSVDPLPLPLSSHASSPAPPTSDETCATDSPALRLATSADIHPNLLAPAADPDLPAHPLFAAAQLGVDRRLLVNRKRQLRMYRVWMQGKFVKL